MAEVMNGLVSEARKNRFSAIPKLEEGEETVNNFNSKSQFRLVYCLSLVTCIVLTSLALKDWIFFWCLDIVSVWDNVSKFIEKQMALQKVSEFYQYSFELASSCTCSGMLFFAAVFALHNLVEVRERPKRPGIVFIKKLPWRSISGDLFLCMNFCEGIDRHSHSTELL